MVSFDNFIINCDYYSDYPSPEECYHESDTDDTDDTDGEECDDCGRLHERGEYEMLRDEPELPNYIDDDGNVWYVRWHGICWVCEEGIRLYTLSIDDDEKYYVCLCESDVDE